MPFRQGSVTDRLTKSSNGTLRLQSEGELGRLAALERYCVMDTPGELAFERITMLAKRALNVPIAILAFIDEHRQWFKAQQGMQGSEIPRIDGFCDYTIRGSEPLFIRDAKIDPRFARNPLVLGDPHIRFYGGIPLSTHDGHNIGSLCAIDTRPRACDDNEIAILADLAGIAMSHFELQNLAMTDTLTGALSRRAFRKEAGSAVAFAKRRGQSLSCISVDIDRFKSVNDMHGHRVGDNVLRRSIANFKAELRKSDIIGRIGGGEFAIILPDVARDAALGVAVRLRKTIKNEVFESAKGSFVVSASMGVASVDEFTLDLDSLVRKANIALYEAKESGRDCCIQATSARPRQSGIADTYLESGLLHLKAAAS